MTFPEPADTVAVDIADTATGGETHGDSVEDPGIWVFPTPMSLPSAPAGQVSGEQAQQEPGAPQELGRRKGGMSSFVFVVALFVFGIDCVGMFMFFPNDGMGP